MSEVEMSVHDVVREAVTEAGIFETTEGSETAVETPVQEAPETAAPVQETKTPEPPDEIAKMLEAEGFKAGPPHRENRIPHSRVRDMITKTLTKKEKEWLEKHGVELKTRDTKLSEYEAKVRQLEALEEMAQDDEKFVRMLAQNNPKYARYLKVLEAKEEAAAGKPDNDPMPGPDHPDGYTTEGLKKLQEWQIRQAEGRARAIAKEERAAMEKEYRPLKERYEAQETREQMRPVVQRMYTDACDLYGKDLVDRHSAEISAAMAKDRQERRGTPPEVIIARVLTPKIRDEQTKLTTDRTKIRQELLEEQKKKPLGASKGASGSVKEVIDVNDMSPEDIVRQSVAKARQQGIIK